MEERTMLNYREEIIAAVRAHQIVIIKAETGSGKSTKVPQFLLECAERVVVTQPRRLAAQALAKRVAEDMNVQLGSLVGYHTALERNTIPATQLIFCTDGLQLVHEIAGINGSQEILVIDEVHEWNMNIELLIAWIKRRLAQRSNMFRLVIMSATVDTSALAAYFGGAHIIEIPGRSFPITEQPSCGNIVADAVKLLQANRNVLIFQPGKKEVSRTIAALMKSGVDAEIMPLHAEITFGRQSRCFLAYDRPKCVVATNVAQTSLTIPDIDAVIDSGLERQNCIVGGVQGLYVHPISLADRAQRKGRAGRTKPGIYIDACPQRFKAERSEFSIPDIMRLPLDRALLLLLSVGMDITELSFFHQPNPQHIAAARQRLFALGCIGEDALLTDIGKKVARLPITPRFGRMIVEAEQYGGLDEILTLVAVMEQGGIIDRKNINRGRIAKMVTDVTDSDVLFELAAYCIALTLRRDQHVNYGIDTFAFERAFLLCKRLEDMLNKAHPTVRMLGSHANIIRAIVSGLTDHCYERSVIGGYKDREGNYRDLPEDSVVRHADRIVGLPWNLEVEGNLGPRTLRFIQMATAVTPELLREIAPHCTVSM